MAWPHGGRHGPIHESHTHYGHINPNLGAGAAAAGSVLRGVGAFGNMGRAALRGDGVNTPAIRQNVGNIKSDAQGMRAAYNGSTRSGKPLRTSAMKFLPPY